MALKIKIKRATQSQIDGAAAFLGLSQGEPYWITDQQQLAIGIDDRSYEIIGGGASEDVWEPLGNISVDGTKSIGLGITENGKAYCVEADIMITSPLSGDYRISAHRLVRFNLFYNALVPNEGMYASDLKVISESGLILNRTNGDIVQIGINDIAIDLLRNELVASPPVFLRLKNSTSYIISGSYNLKITNITDI